MKFKITFSYKSFAIHITLIAFLSSVTSIMGIKLSVTEKNLSHKLHWSVFSPLWILKWHLGWLFVEKPLLYSVPHYRFSPVCVLTWLTRLHFTANDIGQYILLNGFSPACFTKRLTSLLLYYYSGSIDKVLG